MWVPQVLLLRPGAIGPMESARYQGYEWRGASSAFQRVIWDIKRQNIFVCFSDVTHVTIHGTSTRQGDALDDSDAKIAPFQMMSIFPSPLLSSASFHDRGAQVH